jgi:DNA-binding transcriptional LysR family regulator
MNLSTKDIECFLALVRTQHFTRAAEQCHLSQSAFSGRIQRLEDRAGLRLFERSTRHVTLTPEGETLAQELQRIDEEIRDTLTGLRELATRRSGRVAVAALPSVAAAWMPEVIARYRSANPNIRVALFDALAESSLAMLREGKVDLAVTAGGDLREFDTTVLRRESFYMVCHRTHELAARKHVTLAQLAGRPMVHLSANSSVRQQLDVFPQFRNAPPDTLQVEHLATVAALVAKGLGISVVPELALFHFRTPALRAVPVRDARLRRPVVLARRKGKALSIAAKAMFAEIVRQAESAASPG